MKLELTSEQLKTVEIALAELAISDIWTSGRNEADIDRIAARAVYILNIIETYNKNNPSKK
jgi:hypothetical protein